MVACLVDDAAVQIQAAQTVVVLCAVKPDPRPVVREYDRQFAFADLHARNGGCVFLEVGPGDVLGLRVGRRDVGKARLAPRVFNRPDHQIHDARDGLASATVRNKA